MCSGQVDVDILSRTTGKPQQFLTYLENYLKNNDWLIMRRSGSSITCEMRYMSFDDIESYPELFFNDKSLNFFHFWYFIIFNSNDEYIFCFI